MTSPLAVSTEITRLALVATSDGGCRLTGGGGVFRAVLQRRLERGARVALVPERALLLSGDRVALTVVVDPGLRLELVETGGTVAYDMRGGRAGWRTSFQLGRGATVVHETLPWVSAAGSDVERSLEVELEVGARALVRETLVLGRHGEEPGRLRSRTHVRRDGVDVLVEELDAADLAPHRVLDQVASYGDFRPAGVSPAVPAHTRADAIATHLPPAAPGLTCLELASGDTIWRRLDDHAHAAAAGLDRIFASLR